MIENTENINSVWALAEYGGQPAITVLAAPSTEPDKRRANTADTFLFWQDKKAAGTGKRILIVTSQIYVPYQQLEAARILGMQYGHSVETIGFPREWSGNMSGLQTAANYLQEIRSVLQSMKNCYRGGDGMLQETYETAKETRKINILERDEEGHIVDFAEEFYGTEEQRALFTVYGDAGSGKSFLVKNALDKIKHNQNRLGKTILSASTWIYRIVWIRRRSTIALHCSCRAIMQEKGATEQNREKLISWLLCMNGFRESIDRHLVKRVKKLTLHLILQHLLQIKSKM